MRAATRIGIGLRNASVAVCYGAAPVIPPMTGKPAGLGVAGR